MTEYIYFVKCPGCDDESFMFFDEAKGFATSCLSRKPIITQTEVQRNDFGECVDHCDLGTIWSWEEAVGDITCDKPAVKIFTSGDFAAYNPDSDPEFTALDNSFNELDSIPDNFKKPATEIGCISTDAICGDSSASEELTEWQLAPHNNQNTNTGAATSSSGTSTVSGLDQLAVTVKMPDVNISNSIYVCPTRTGTDLSNVTIKAPYSRERMAYGNSFSFSDLFNNVTSAVGKEVFNATGVYPIVRKIWAYIHDSNIILVQSPGFHFIINKADFISQIENQVVNSQISASNVQPIPEGMTIEQLVEEMEENEDTVECTWCNELYDKSECRKEVDMGWLCDRCEAAIKSRGETLTFKENNYWDFLDESIDDEICVDGVLDNLVVDELEAIDGYDCADEAVQHASIPEDEKLKILDTLEHIKKEEEEHIDELRALSSTNVSVDPVDPSEGDSQVLFEDSDPEALLKSGRYLEYINGSSDEDLHEDISKSDTVDLYYDALTITIQSPQRDVDDWDEVEYTDSYTITRSKRDVAIVLWEEGFITEDDVKDVPGGLAALEDEQTWEKFLETDSFDIAVENHYDDLLTYFEDEAKEEFEDEFDWYDYQDAEFGAGIDYDYD